MKAKISIISLVLTVAAALALVGGGSVTSSASQPASAAPVGAAIAANSTAPLTPVGSGFTYQGSLKSGGSPANGQYDFQFTLYDALTGGNLVGGPIATENVTVTVGLFTVTLDFGQPAFQGEARYLGIDVKQTGGGAHTTLTPRQALTPAPYALSLKPGTVISGTGSSPYYAILAAINNGGGSGVIGQSTGDGGDGVYGFSASGSGVRGYSYTNNGVIGQSSTSHGVYGSSGTNHGVYGTTSSGQHAGVQGFSGSTGLGVRGESVNGTGVYGSSTGGIYGTGVYGSNPGGTGVFGTGGINGMEGYSFGAGSGVYGENFSSSGGYGVAGVSHGASSYGVYGRNTDIGGYAGYFVGPIFVTGNCTGCLGPNRIDHPLDPADKYLYQSAVESPDMKTIYDGIAILDATGEAWVEMPSYSQSLNEQFRYQLTPIGAPGRDLYIAQEIQNNRFKIAGGKAGMKVSWQVSGIRHDPYAVQHPVTVEQDKPADEKGKYLHPAEYGQPETMGVGYEQPQGAQQPLPLPPAEPGR